MGGDIVGDVVLLTVGVGVGLFVGGHDDLASFAGVSALDSALDLAASLSGALSLDSALDLAASLSGALSLSLDSAFVGSFTGALASAVAEVELELGDSSAPAGIAPSRSTRSATIIAVTPLLVISLLRDKSSC